MPSRSRGACMRIDGRHRCVFFIRKSDGRGGETRSGRRHPPTSHLLSPKTMNPPPTTPTTPHPQKKQQRRQQRRPPPVLRASGALDADGPLHLSGAVRAAPGPGGLHCVGPHVRDGVCGGCTCMYVCMYIVVYVLGGIAGGGGGYAVAWRLKLNTTIYTHTHTQPSLTQPATKTHNNQPSATHTPPKKTSTTGARHDHYPRRQPPPALHHAGRLPL